MACAIELAEQKPTKKHIDFALSRVRMLIHFGVKPYLVFDGDYLPSKAHTEKERAAKRKESKRLGLELLRMGRPSQAHLELQKAVDVTPSMARELIEELKGLGVEYVVAPYEADAQLAYLEKQGIISGVLSEDSDLLVFGVKCLLTKLDQYGECVMVNRQDFTACRDVSLVGWSDKEFRMMAILSGCDYLPGIDKMGLKTAYRLVRKHKSIDRTIRSVQFDGKMKIPPKYLEAFQQAERTFLYQWAFCPTAQSLVNLNEVPVDIPMESMPYIGADVEPEDAIGVAVGDLDPHTKQRLDFNRRQPGMIARQRVTQTPDEKQGKTITEFFKTQRTPLAELDPNSFTPSPSQQRLLANQRSISWSASQAPVARPPALARIASIQRRQSAPQATERAEGDTVSLSSSTAPKRQRLCSEPETAGSTSRFFSKTIVQPSPSVRKKSNRKEDFELWSDDPVAEAAAQATAALEQESEPSRRKRKKLQVFEDPPVPQSNGEQEEVLQSTIATTDSQYSQKSSGQTPLTSFEAEVSQPDATVFTNGVNANFAALKSSFALSGQNARTEGSHAGIKSLEMQTPLPATFAKSSKTVDKQLKRTERATAAVATEDTTKALYREDTDLVPASSRVLCASPLGIGRAKGKTAPGSSTEDREETASITACGSEDFLIPNSPDSARDDDRARPKLNFSRFAFGS